MSATIKSITLATGLLCMPLVAGAAPAEPISTAIGLVQNVKDIRDQFRQLADEYGLSTSQKLDIRLIIANALPDAMALGNEMLSNRQRMLDLTTGQDELDDALVLEIANQQGQLLTELIVFKERLKKDVRSVLDQEQKQLIDELLAQLMARRLMGV